MITIDLDPVDCEVNNDINMVYWNDDCTTNCGGGTQTGLLSTTPSKWGGSDDTCSEELRRITRVCNTISCDHVEQIGDFGNRIDLPIYNSRQSGALLPLFFNLANRDGTLDSSPATTNTDLLPYHADMFVYGFRVCFQLKSIYDTLQSDETYHFQLDFLDNQYPDGMLGIRVYEQTMTLHFSFKGSLKLLFLSLFLINCKICIF